MRDYNEEYFYLERDGTPSFPLLEVDEHEEEYKIQNAKKWVELDRPFMLCFGDPVPRKPKMADYHSLPQSVVSEKIKKVFDELNIPDVQLIHSTILNTRTDEVIDGYYLVKVYNRIACMDREKSVWKSSASYPHIVGSIKKLVLDNEVLDKIPLEKRLAFALEENTAHEVFHYTVVSKIMETQPTGLKPYPLKKWDSSAPFNDEYWAALGMEKELEASRNQYKEVIEKLKKAEDDDIPEI